MPGNPPPFDNETDGILLYLIQQRDGLRFAAYGLTEEQLRQRATPASALTVGGLLKHATRHRAGLDRHPGGCTGREDGGGVRLGLRGGR